MRRLNFDAPMAGQTPIGALHPVTDKRRAPVFAVEDECWARLRFAAQSSLNAMYHPPHCEGDPGAVHEHDKILRRALGRGCGGVVDCFSDLHVEPPGLRSSNGTQTSARTRGRATMCCRLSSSRLKGNHLSPWS